MEDINKETVQEEQNLNELGALSVEPETDSKASAERQLPRDYVPINESQHELYQVQVGEFDGPLDLLLFLIRRHEIDIFDIPIAFICDRYVEELNRMEDLNIDIATEYMVLAAELIHIKSKLLLPKPADIEDEDEEDPRAELVRRLLEYQKYRDGAAQLKDLYQLGRDVFDREPEDLPPREGEIPLKEVGVYALVSAFQKVVDRQKPEFRHHVAMEHVSVQERIDDMVQRLVDKPRLSFQAILQSYVGKTQVIVTFLAMLEMCKYQLLRFYQLDNESAELYVQARFQTLEEAKSILVNDALDYRG